MRFSLNTLILILVALFFGLYFKANANSEQNTKESPSVYVQTALVEARELKQTLTVFGTLDPDPDLTTSLSLLRSGLVNRVWIRVGQRVQSGDRLLELITAPESRMQYLQAQSAVAFAERDLQRQQRLLGEKMATKAAVESAQKSLLDARATYEALKQKGQNLERQTLRAPMDGIVTELYVGQGERVQAETTALLIAAERPLVARMGVEPEDLEKIKTGTKATVASVFVPEMRFESEIAEIHAMINPNTHLVEVLIPISPDEFHPLVLGSRVTGEIELASFQSKVVPRSAVLKEGGQSYIYLVESSVAKKIKVEVVGEDANAYAILGGINSGDKIVRSGNYQLEDGMLIRENP